MSKSLKILLTGSSGAIGSSIQERLKQDRHTIIAPSSAELDLSSTQSVANWLSDNSQEWFDGIILSAGINRPELLIQTDESELSKILEVNLRSNRRILAELLPGMAERKFGRIVAISSAYSIISRVGRSSYSISKAGLDALIRSAAVEYGPDNILANLVAPGFINTSLTLRNNTDDQLSKILERVPMTRLGEPGEVSSAVAFLISAENTFITGQRLNVDGGFSVN